jgi:MYXO-CTERM domain-containing protein
VKELVTVDETGEDLWLYGSEDIAGDGDAFNPPEPNLDIRTAYATSDASRFWARAYVSAADAPGANVLVFVFIDADNNATTGGSAAATAIDPRFTTDASGGGYEHVVATRGNGTVHGLWHWNGGTMVFDPENVNPNEATAEVGADTDPILLGSSTHGYLQIAINHAKVGLAPACQARLYFRSLDASGSGPSDADVGDSSPCISVDANADGVPDVLVPDEGCTNDDQCPYFGICVDGRCVVGRPCDDISDCRPGDVCDGGRCVAPPGGSCDTTEDCGDLVCVGGNCNACSPGGDECGAGRRCGPDGRCTDGSSTGAGGVDLGPGDRVQGGPCACGFEASSESARVAGAAFAALAALAMRRRRFERKHSGKDGKAR